MTDRFQFTEPMLCDYEGDTSRPWFVYFTVTDNFLHQSKRVQARGPINRSSDKGQRTRLGKALVMYWKQQLECGWTPWNAEPEQELPTVQEAFEKILQLKKTTCGKRTCESYAYAVNMWLKFCKRNNLLFFPLTELKPVHCRAFFDEMALSDKYSNRTYNDKITIMSTFANAMVERDWITKNPFTKIKKLPITVGRNIAFTEDEKQRLRDLLYIKDKQLYYFTQFVYYCFIRRSELTRLRIGDIDFSSRSIIVPASASKNRKQESVVLPHSFLPILEEMQLQGLPKEWYIFGRHLRPGPKQYVNYNHISTRHNRHLCDLGISDQKGLYSWKHSGACALYKVLNGDVYSLMRQLRHHDLNVTQIYLKSLGLLDNAAVRSAVW